MKAPRSGGLNSVCASLLDIHGTEDCRECIHGFGRQPCTQCESNFGCPLDARRPPPTDRFTPFEEGGVIACEKCHHTPESLMNCPTGQELRTARPRIGCSISGSGTGWKPSTP